MDAHATALDLDGANVPAADLARIGASLKSNESIVTFTGSDHRARDAYDEHIKPMLERNRRLAVERDAARLAARQRVKRAR